MCRRINVPILSTVPSRKNDDMIWKESKTDNEIMDKKLTESLQKWLSTPREERDYEQGNLLLFRLSGNKIQYRNLAPNPAKHAEFITRNIQKYVNFRVQEFTHEQVKEMEKKVEKIFEKRLSIEENNPARDFKKGKRADHDSLPEEIRSLYVENLGIAQRMRDVQTKLRLISTEESPCPDSERYPFLKELISLDKQLHENWERYDRYVPQQGQESGNASGSLSEESRKALRLVTLNKGKYAKKPTPELKARILEWYGLITDPAEKLTEELKRLGILE